MTIDEATKTLAFLFYSGKLANWPEARAAVQLGTEALKRIGKVRYDHKLIAWRALPGETRE